MDPTSAKVLAYFKYYGTRMRQSLEKIGSNVGLRNNGVWAPACLDHGSDFGFNHTKLTVNGVTLKDALLSWYRTKGAGGQAANVHMEKCAEKGSGQPCSSPPGRCRSIPLLRALE